MKRSVLINITIVLAIIILSFIWLYSRPLKILAPTPDTVEIPKITPPAIPNATIFDKKQYSLSDPNSNWVIVNKHLPLNPVTYVPPDLITPNVLLRSSTSSSEMMTRNAVALALENMFALASSQNIKLMLASGYRSYNLQTTVYANEISANGQLNADKQSARPGHSEHQTGLAVDIEPANRQCELSVCFADLPEGKWLAQHASDYGFIIRYPDGQQSIVGYTYEPWHIRYVGKELAKEVSNSKLTLEQFFDLPPAPDYQ